VQADRLRSTGALTGLVHNPLPSLALRPAHGRADQVYAKRIRPKRKKPFAAELCLLAELDSVATDFHFMDSYSNAAAEAP
jgi:hypothetical protein